MAESMPKVKVRPSVSMHGIVKRFPGVLANDHIDFEAMPGQVQTLLGENGAGKSTLMNILSGLYIPDEGEVLIRGERVRFGSPSEAIAHGIGMIYQHFMLVETHTVAENIILGMSKPRFHLNLHQVEREISELAKKYGMHVDPHAYIWQLSVGEQQRVEILKMLYRGANILILDEPTAVLTPPEVEDLFSTLHRMTHEDKTIIFISHKLEEVMAISDRITVLRGGRSIATVARAETNPRDLACMMVGREVLIHIEKKQVPIGPVVLEVSDLRANNQKGMPALKGVSFNVRAGEVLGVAGVAGNGQRELAEVITGLRRPTGGRVRLNGKDVTNSSPQDIIAQKVSHIPEDRMGTGLVANLSVSDNVILKEYEKAPLSHGLFLQSLSIRQFANRLVERFDISTPGVQTQMRLLSGGNQQKALLAREMNTGPVLMVAVHPTRGLDVGATATVRELLLSQRESGSALLLISEDLDEILQLSDRIAVMYEGEIRGIVSSENVKMEKIGLMMAGADRQAETIPAGMEQA